MINNPQDPLELTEKHIAVVVNDVLTKMSLVLNQSQSTFEATKALAPLSEVFKALHTGMVQSRTARAAQSDPAAQLEIERQKMHHQHALDIMAQQFEQQLEKQQMEHKLHLESRKAEADEQRVGLEQLALVKQMEQQQQTHQQQTAQAQEQHDNNIIQQQEMHESQLQQAEQPSTE